MPTVKKKVNLFDTEEGAEIEKALRIMAEDKGFSTKASYSTNSTMYPNNSIPFVDKHMSYLSAHPSVDPEHYLANLRLITKIR